MHHGYYPHKSYKNHSAAQLDMIDRSLAFAYGDDEALPRSVVDIGCGVGGSSRHIARKYSSIKKARGISLSPYQISRANAFTRDQNLANLIEYKVDDAMSSSFADNEFDLTWSMESGEHMPDKEQFVKELIRVTSPGGRIIVVTWCHRELKEEENALSDEEVKLLQKINEAYFLPAWVPPSTYVALMKENKLEDVRSDDWSEYVMPFWPAVFRSALKPRNFLRMVRSGRTTVKGAWAGTFARRVIYFHKNILHIKFQVYANMRMYSTQLYHNLTGLWMLQGFATGTIKFALITGRKPQI